MRSVFYERLFQLNRCLEQAGEILDLYELDGLIHPGYATARKSSLEDIRADLCVIIGGLIHQRELNACLGGLRSKTTPGRKNED